MNEHLSKILHSKKNLHSSVSCFVISFSLYRQNVNTQKSTNRKEIILYSYSFINVVITSVYISKDMYAYSLSYLHILHSFTRLIQIHYAAKSSNTIQRCQKGRYKNQQRNSWTKK